MIAPGDAFPVAFEVGSGYGRHPPLRRPGHHAGHVRPRRMEAAQSQRVEIVGRERDVRPPVGFLGAYRAGLLERGAWADVDPDLLHAFEVDKELYEFAYATTYLPSWLYAPTEGMRALFEEDRR